jgi:hypothetical protein
MCWFDIVIVQRETCILVAGCSFHCVYTLILSHRQLCRADIEREFLSYNLQFMLLKSIFIIIIVCGFFNDTVSTSVFIASKRRMINK